MDQHSPDTLPSVELPSPEPVQTPETSPQTDMYSEKASSKQLEQAPIQQVPRAQQPASQALPPLQGPMVPPRDPIASSVPTNTTPQMADDADLIEKEWVDRAKRIVEHTRHDPHLQTKEMNNMKADYLKKRYNKDLKLSE